MSDLELNGPWSAVRRAPMLRMTVPFVAGLALARLVPMPAGLLLPVLAAVSLPTMLVLLGPAQLATRWRRGALLLGWFLLFGLCWQSLRDSARDPLSVAGPAAEGPFLARIVQVNGASRRVFRADAALLARATRDGLDRRRGTFLLTLLPESSSWPEPGDVVALDAHLEPIERASDPGGFDRAAWARGRGITHELLASSGRWHVVGHSSSWTDLFRHTREAVEAWLERGTLPQAERALVKALVLGQRDELDSEQTTAFARSGTIHVLAVSGMHVGLIYAALSALLGQWGAAGRGRLLRGTAILAALWGYAGLTGASPSVLRATFMFSLFTAAGMAKRQTDHLNSLFAAGFFLLVWDPAMLTQAGFQLSFLAVLGIILLYRPVAALWAPKAWLLRQAWSLAVVSFCAQLLTAPLSILLFKAFPVWFLPANLVVVTAVSLSVYGGVALILLQGVPVLGEALTWCLTMLLRGIGLLTGWFANLPFAYPALRIGPLEVALLYALIGALAAAAVWRWKRMWRVAMACLAAILLMGAWRAKRVAESNAFVVYDDTRALMAAMLHGRTLVAIAPADSLLHSSRFRAKIDRHERWAGLDTIAWSTIDPGSRVLKRTGAVWSAGPRWRSAAHSVLFASQQRCFTGQPYAYDAVVFHDMEHLDNGRIAQWAEAHHWVIAAGVALAVRHRLLQEAESLGIPAHVVGEHGAFVLQAKW